MMNMALFQADVLHNNNIAIGTIDKALNDGNDKIDDLNDQEDYKESKEIIELMKENQKLWKTEIDVKTKEEEDRIAKEKAKL